MHIDWPEKVEDMERQVEKIYESLAPTFEKLAKFNELKTAQKNRREFLKSTKSYRAKATINQEYSQKILDLEKAVRLIERMNEKKVRLNKASVSASVHRINSMELKRRDHSPVPLSQNSSFITENKRSNKDQLKELLSLVNVPSGETKSSFSVASSLLKKLPASEEKITLRKVEQMVDNITPSGTEFIEQTSKMKIALSNLRSLTVQDEEKAIGPKEIEFIQVQLNSVISHSPDNQETHKEQDARHNLLSMAKSSLRQMEQTEEENKMKEEQENNSKKQKNNSFHVQLRIKARDADEEGTLRDDVDVVSLLARKRDSLQVVPNKRDSMVSTSEMPPLTSEELSPPASEIVMDSSASVSSLADHRSAIAASENHSQYYESQADISASQAGNKSRVLPPFTIRSSSDHCKDSGPIIQNSVFGDSPSIRDSNQSNNEDEADSVSSKISPRSNISSNQVKDTSSVITGNDISSPPRTTVDIEHLKDSLRPVMRRDNSNRQKQAEDQDQTSAVPIMHAKEHLNHVVHRYGKNHDDDNQWAAPILQAKETLRPITAREREKELNLKSPAVAAVADGSPGNSEKAGETPSPPSVAVKATEFERKASVFGKLIRKVSGIMDHTAAATLSPAYAERIQHNQESQNTPGGAALFEHAAALDDGPEDHSMSRQKMRDPSYDPTNRHHDHDDEDFGDDNAIVHDDEFMGDLGISAPASSTTRKPDVSPSTSQKVATPNTDVQVISLTKVNLERTASLRAEKTDSNGPVNAFRGSFTTDHKKPSFVENYQNQLTPDALNRSASPIMSPGAATTAAVANSTSPPIVDPFIPGQNNGSSELQLETASQATGSETENQVKKKKSGMNFMKGLRKRTSSIFGSKFGSNLNITAAASVDSTESSPVPGQQEQRTPRASAAVETASVSDAGFDDSASQSDKRNKSGGFSGFMRSSSSMFRRSKSGNYNGANTTGNEGIIPEDEVVDFSESIAPMTGSEKVPIDTTDVMVNEQGQDDLDETGSQMTANSEKKKRLSMKGFMKRTSSLFKK